MENKFDIGSFVNVSTEQSITQALVKRFKKRRKAYGLTQQELSVKSGVSYGSIRRFESSGDISLHALLKISAAVDSLEDFSQLFGSFVMKDLKDYHV